jgi:hypothetical protein
MAAARAAVQHPHVHAARPASAPATKSSESPGRKGVTTKPVSEKMMTNRMAYTQMPYCCTSTGEMLVEMKDDVQELHQNFHEKRQA